MCPSCGEPVGPGERKVVTVLFADLAGYTELASALDPEDVFAFIHPAMTSLRKVVEGFGGTVPQVMGDGFMAVFGVPTAHEDDAERAVRAALALVRRAGELNAVGVGPALPEVHVGVNTGEVMVARSREASGFSVTGDTVNVASRLCSMAPGGRVLVGSRTVDLTTHAVRYGPQRHRRAKGKPQPLAVREAVDTMTPVGAGRAPSPMSAPFVGREAALARLQSELRAAVRTGRSRVLVVVGDAGVGKTRLAATFRAMLDGATVMAGRCPPYGERLPQFPLTEALRDLAGIPPEASARQAGAALDRLVRRVTRGEGGRSLARQARLLLGVDGASLGTGSAGSMQDVRLALRGLVEALARSEPVVIVLDDLHWADPALLELLGEIDAAPWSGPALWLGLSRPELGRDHGLPTFALDTLTAEPTRTLIRSILGPGLPERVVAGLATRSGGNPLFLEESVRMLMDSGALAEMDGRVVLADSESLGVIPTTLRLLVAARVDLLTAVEKHVLQDAAVAGESTWDRLAEHLLDGDGARAALRALEGRDLLRRLSRSRFPRSTEYEFTHVLIRDVVYQSLPQRERAGRHLRVAEWLESRTTGRGEEPVAALAHHYEQAWKLSRARTGPDRSIDAAERASLYLGRWGDLALAYQPRLAESAYGRGIAIARTAPEETGPALLSELLIGRAESTLEVRRSEALVDAREALDLAVRSRRDDLRGRALLALGRVESDAGDVVRARRRLEDALDLFQRLGDSSGQARALHRLSETWRFDDFRREVDLLVLAEGRFLGSGDLGGRAMVAQDLAYLLTIQGGPEFLRRYEEAKRVTGEAGDLRSRATLARTWSYYCYYRGDHREAQRAARRAVAMASDAGDPWLEMDSRLIEALVASTIDRPEEAERLSGVVVAEARSSGFRRMEALGLMAGIRPALRTGNPGLARRRLRRLRTIQRDLRATVETVEANLEEARLYLDRGAWHRVRRPAQEAADQARLNGWRLLEPHGPLLAGRAALGAGRLDDAETELERSSTMAEAAGAPGAVSLAAALLEQTRLVLGRRPRTRAPRPGTATIEIDAVRAENDGLRALGAGDLPRAVTAFDRAVARWEELGSTVWLARALRLQSAALRRQEQSTAARPLERRALRVLRSVEAPADAIEPPDGLTLPARASGRSRAGPRRRRG